MKTMTDDENTDPGSNAISKDCPACGGGMTWNPSVLALVCAYCGSAEAVEGAKLLPADRSIEEFERAQVKELFLASSRRLRCDKCGAVIDFHGSLSSRCDFCGAHAVAEIHQHAEAIRPAGVIPFQVDREAVKKKYDEWVKEQPLLPEAIRSGVPLEELRGIYVPFWVFDVRVNKQISALCGFERVDEHEGQRYMQWERRSVNSSTLRTGLGVYASTGLPESLMDQLNPWYAESANAWDEAFVRGFPAEAPSLEPAAAWEQAKKVMYSLEMRDSHGHFGAQQTNDLELSCTYEGGGVRLIYQPVWVAAFRFGGRVFRFLVNGRTGESAGQAPVDKRKLALALVAGGLLALLVAGPAVCMFVDEYGPERASTHSFEPMPIEIDRSERSGEH